VPCAGQGERLGLHQALSEGWADITSFLIWGDAVVGEYVTGNAATGIRRVAYDDSDHTYSTYDPNAGSGHPNGEVWATMVYDIRAALGIDATAWLVYTGMKATPGQPDFLDARDGIFSADTLVNGGDNHCLLWGIFAGRGLGTGATFDLSSTTSPADDFEVPDDCRPTAEPGGPYATDEGLPGVTLDASGSSPGADATTGPIVSYEWDLDNDGQFDDATGVTTQFVVGDDGVYTVGLRVTNEAGISDEATTTVTVSNVDPTVAIAPGQVTAIDEGDSGTVTATYSDPGWLDTHTATIDWGTPAGDVTNPVPTVTDTGNPGPVQGTVTDTFTYGDPTTPKRSLQKLERGDYLIFYCGLQEWGESVGWRRNRPPALYIVGYFEVEMAGMAADFSKSTLKVEFGRNFHVRYPSVFNVQRDRLVLVKGGSGSRLLEKARLISAHGTDRSGKPLKVLSPSMQKVFGDFDGRISLQRSPPRWVPPGFVEKAIGFVTKLT
jgi:hypothetical protein